MSDFEAPIEMRIQYVDRRLVELDHLAGLEDLTELQTELSRFRHQMTGNLAMFGFGDLMPFIERLQNPTDHAQRERIVSELSHLRQEFSNLREQLSRTQPDDA